MRDRRTLTLYIFIFVFSESFSSTVFRLEKSGLIIGDSPQGPSDLDALPADLQMQEAVFRIICNGPVWAQQPVNISDFYDVEETSGGALEEESLDCGKPVNFTYYDDLLGVSNRFSHPIVPELESSYIFLTLNGGGGGGTKQQAAKTFDIDALERRLKKAKREKPKSVQLYNQIGNFWRIKGDARQSIECFRRALAVSPTNAEVLLNLARVLFNLQFLDDAIYLTRRSLEVQPPDKSPWKQYLTLGEIFKAYGHFQESQIHLRHALELAPDHIGIKQALLDVENIPSSTLHAYTILIILFLAMGVLLVVISSTDSGQLSDISSPNPRHINKVLFRSQHKVFRNIKCRK